MKARTALLVCTVVAIAGILAVALVRVLTYTEKPEMPVSESIAGKQVGPVVAPKQSPPAFTIGKQTTYVAGPLDKDGYVDYVAALNERMGQGVTPETNANVLIWKALGPTPGGHNRMPEKFFKLMGMEEPPEKGDYFVDLKEYIRQQLKIEDGELAKKLEEQLLETSRYPWLARDHPQFAEWLKANEKPLTLVVEASKRSGYFSPVASGSILGSNDPAQYQCRELTKALASRALLKVCLGQDEDAWQDLLACHRLARLVGRGGPFPGILNGYGVDQIAETADVAFLDRAGLNAEQIQACVRDLRALPSMPSMADFVDVGERFNFLDELMMFAKHGLWYVEQLTPAGLVTKNLVDAPVKNINWDPGLRTANQWYDRFVVAMREKDRPTRHQRLELLQKEYKERKDRLRGDEGNEKYARALLDLGITPEAKGEFYGELLIGMLMPDFQKLQVVADRAEQWERNLHVAFALAAYQRDHGAYPKTLDALVPKYLAKVPDDLFTGKPLVYKHSDNAYLLYSLGSNGKDDEGRGPDDEPKGDDIAVRVPAVRSAKK